MKYQEWLAQIPAEIKDDPLWKSEVYRLALFLGDLAWHDACKLAEKPFSRSLADQLLRAAGSISANICDRLNLLTQIIRQLMRMVPKHRGNTIQEDGIDYETL